MDYLKLCKELADNQDIRKLKEALPSYPKRNDVNWDSSKEQGQLRTALREHITKVIAKSSSDLILFYQHFSS